MSTVASSIPLEETFSESKKPAWWGNRTVAGMRRQSRRAEELIRCFGSLHRRVLELGCADGCFTGFVSRMLDEEAVLVCTDIIGNVLARPSLHGSRVRAVQANALYLPFKDESFDLVIGNAILHHLDLTQAIPECLRVLINGGGLFFTEPNLVNPIVFCMKQFLAARGWAGETPGETAFIRWSLYSSLQKLGVSEVRVEPFDFLFPLIPTRCVRMAEQICSWFEQSALIRELGGSLLITGRKKWVL